MFGKAQGLYPCMDARGCPEQALSPGEERFCPCWYSAESGAVLTEANVQTGEERIVKGCFFQVIPSLMIHVIRASNRPAEEMSAMRGDMALAAAKAVQTTLVPLADAMQRALPHNGNRESLIDGKDH